MSQYELDPHEELFAQGLAMGFTPLQSSVESRLDMTAVEAGMLSQKPHIKGRVLEIVKLDEFDSSLEHLRIARQLEVDRDFAYEVGQPSAAINATVQRAKLLGLFVERTESTSQVAVRGGNELSPIEWAEKFGVSGEDE